MPHLLHLSVLSALFTLLLAQPIEYLEYGSPIVRMQTCNAPATARFEISAKSTFYTAWYYTKEFYYGLSTEDKPNRGLTILCTTLASLFVAFCLAIFVTVKVRRGQLDLTWVRGKLIRWTRAIRRRWKVGRRHRMVAS